MTYHLVQRSLAHLLVNLELDFYRFGLSLRCVKRSQTRVRSRLGGVHRINEHLICLHGDIAEKVGGLGKCLRIG